MKRTPMLILVTIASGTAGCVASEPTPLDGDTAVSATSAALVHGGANAHATYASLWHAAEQQRCSPPSAAMSEALLAAANRVADLQADQIGDNAGNGLDDGDPDDGGWDWTVPTLATEHTADPSPQNTYGTTGLGMWAAERAGLTRARITTALLDAGLGLQRRNDGFSNADVLFLALLSSDQDNPGFATLARARYDAQRTAAGGALQLGEQQRDQRHAGNQDGLIAYDLASLALAADALDALNPGAGYADDVVTYATLVQSDLSSSAPLFDRNDGSEGYYTHGLAWSLVALSRGAGTQKLMAAVRDQLVALQHDDGSWGWNADHPESNLQGTAHAATALALTAPNSWSARNAVLRATSWLLGHQTDDGGWDSAQDTENPQIDAEVMLSLHLAHCLPGGESLQPSAADAGSAPSYPTHDMPPAASPCMTHLR